MSADDFGFFFVPVSVLIYTYFCGYNDEIVLAIKQNPLNAIGLFVLYMSLGVVWSFYKYFLFIRKWIYIVKDNPNYVDKEAYVRDVTSIQYNIGKISSWIVNWPFSIIYYVFNNLIKDCIEFIIEHFSFVYNYILEFTLKGLK